MSQRAKPFSNKAKKAQLQEKRARKRGERAEDLPSVVFGMAGAEDDEEADVETGPLELDTLGRGALHQKGNEKDRRTFFKKEKKEVAEARKRVAMQPFVRLPPSALELSVDALRVSETVW